MIKVNCNVPLGSGLNPYEPLHHHIIGSVLGGLISGAFGLAGQAAQASYTKEQQKLQSKLNKEEMATSQGMQNAQQDWLMNNQYGKMVSGMKNAGLNPATANGTSPVTPSAGHGSSGGVGPSGPPTSSLGSDIVSGAAAGMQLESLNQDIKAKQLDNRLKELNLHDEEEASKFGYRNERQYKDPDTGEIIDDLSKWESDHPNKIPELVVIKHNRGQEKQRQQENEWNTQNFERETRNATAQLETAIKSGQLKDQEVMNAFIKLPENQRKTLQKMWREYDDNHDLAELQKDIAKLQKQDIENTSFGALVKTLKGDMGFGEKLFATLGFLANRFTQNTSFSFGWKH